MTCLQQRFDTTVQRVQVEVEVGYTLALPERGFESVLSSSSRHSNLFLIINDTTLMSSLIREVVF